MAHLTKQEIFPSLPLQAWEDTKDTLQLYLQIIGKIRLALMPRRNHWWNVTLYVTSRGLATSPIPYDDFTFDIQFDFFDHELKITCIEGSQGIINLEDGLSVAEFYDQVFATLEALGIRLKISARPYENKSTIPFEKDYMHNSYDIEWVHRYWQILVQVDKVFKEFSGRFYGKTSPVHLFWHSMDLVITRFSGKKAPLSKPKNIVEKDAYSHELISFGFWPGDENVRGAAFYSYTYPAPAGIEKEVLMPQAAQWINQNGSPMALMMYDDLRHEENQEQVLLDFLESSYLAGARRAGWEIEELRVPALR
jgi:hypothetical protein